MKPFNYNGYLSAHVEIILQQGREGVPGRKIASQLFASGVRSLRFQEASAKTKPLAWWDQRALLHDHEIEVLAQSVRNVLDKAGLLRPLIPNDTSVAIRKRAERRLRTRPLDLGDDGQRDRWHIWGCIEQYREFGGFR